MWHAHCRLAASASAGSKWICQCYREAGEKPAAQLKQANNHVLRQGNMRGNPLLDAFCVLMLFNNSGNMLPSHRSGKTARDLLYVISWIFCYWTALSSHDSTNTVSVPLTYESKKLSFSIWACVQRYTVDRWRLPYDTAFQDPTFRPHLVVKLDMRWKNARRPNLFVS